MFCSLVPLRLYFSRVKRKYFSSAKQPVMNYNIDYEQSSKKHKIKEFFSRYLNGYIRYFVFQVSIIPSHVLRNFIYKKVLLINMGKNTIIYFGAEIRDSHKLKIGKGTIIGDKAILDARNEINIGENVNLSSNVQIWTEQHDHRDPLFRCNSDKSFKVTIMDRSWLGPNVTVLPGVTIGEGAVVAAGSVVTKSVDSFTIVAGIPAKKIGDRNRNLIYEFNSRPLPFY